MVSKMGTIIESSTIVSGTLVRHQDYASGIWKRRERQGCLKRVLVYEPAVGRSL
ncbi:hypothetical protein CHS0354_037362, partial [Potamilus streckersoni]